MFVYQDSKLYAEHEGVLHGVNLTPEGILDNGETAEFTTGDLMTWCEFDARFGSVLQELKESVGVAVDTIREDETPTRGRGRPRRTV